MNRRVVITGAGSINSLGAGYAAYAKGLREGRVAIGPVSLFSTSGYRSSLAAEVKELSAPAWVPRNIARHASRSDLMALIAAREALDSAAWPGDFDELGVILGTTTGGMGRGERYIEQRRQGEAAPPSALRVTPTYSTASVVGQVFACGGPRLTISTACSSGANALGVASDWIRRGKTRAVLCGGVDTLCRMTFLGFNSLQAIDSQPCRPFDRRRAGLTLGEAAALFVLEDAENAARRGASILAEFLGYGVSADAHHITQPRPDGAGAILAMRRALDASAVDPGEIDYVNAHGTGTPLNDRIETHAIKTVFGQHAYEIPVSSTKSMIGHCLGAAGAAEALAGVVALREQFVPPTAGLEEPDPECDLDYVPGASRSIQLRTILSYPA